MIVELATALIAFTLELRSSTSDTTLEGKNVYGCPDFAKSENRDLPMNFKIASEICYIGEPWGSKARRMTACSNAAIFLGLTVLIMFAHQPFEEFFRSASEAAWPLAFLGFLGCFLTSMQIGVNRTINNLLLARCAALPARDAQGTDFLMFLGDIPSLDWLYQGKPRVLAFFGATALTALAGFLGAYLFDNLLSTNPAETFFLIVGASLLLTQLAARALLGDFGGFPPIPS